MLVHPRPGARRVAPVVLALAAAVLLLPGCGTSPAGSAAREGAPSSWRVDPAAGPDGADAGRSSAGDVGTPYEVVLTGDLRDLAAGRPDAEDAVVELRVVVAGGRSHITTRAGGQILDQHVTTVDGHWLWVPPQLRDDLVDAEWVHLDVGAIEDAGLPLPGHVASARGAVPTPDDVAIGDVVGGMEVRGVEELAGDAVRLTMAGVPAPMTLRRRPLPRGTQVQIPADAVDALDVPGLLAG